MSGNSRGLIMVKNLKDLFSSALVFHNFATKSSGLSVRVSVCKTRTKTRKRTQPHQTVEKRSRPWPRAENQQTAKASARLRQEKQIGEPGCWRPHWQLEGGQSWPIHRQCHCHSFASLVSTRRHWRVERGCC